jgi:acyl carrier protein
MSPNPEMEKQIRIVAEALEGCSLPSVEGDRFRFDENRHMDCELASFGFDSLTTMELCIAIHCATGIELSLEEVARLKTPRALCQHLASLS